VLLVLLHLLCAVLKALRLTASLYNVVLLLLLLVLLVQLSCAH
jgi:hypothetical protein